MKKPVLVGAIAVLVLLVCPCCIGIAYLAKQDQEHYAPLAAACEGRGVPGAAAYVAAGGNRIVYFERSGSTWIESGVEVPSAMRGEGVSDTALVACAADDTTRRIVEQCCFERSVVGLDVPGSETCMPRVQLARHVELRIAATGALLAQRDVLGEEPKACDDWVGRRPSASNFEGAEPDSDQFVPFFLAPLDTPPVPPTPFVIPAAPVDAGTSGK